MELTVSLHVTVDGRSFEISQSSEYTSSPLLHKDIQEMVLHAADAAVRAFPPVPSKYSDSLFKVQANGMHGVVAKGTPAGLATPDTDTDIDGDYDDPDYDA